MRPFIALAFVTFALAPVTAAPAQQAGGIAVGVTVLDGQGNPVGTITAVKDDAVTIKTDKVEAQVGKASFATQNGKVYFGMTQAQLNAFVEKDRLAVEASLAVGKPIKGAQGAEIGVIEAIDADFVTIKLTSGKTVRVPRSGVAGSADGAFIGLSASELEAQVTG